MVAQAEAVVQVKPDEARSELPEPRFVRRVAEVRLPLGVAGVVPIANHRRGDATEDH